MIKLRALLFPILAINFVLLVSGFGQVASVAASEDVGDRDAFRYIRFSGTLKLDSESDHAPRRVFFSIYESYGSLSPLYQEYQDVTPAEGGRFTVLLGKGSASGLPRDIFATAEARWVGVQTDGVEISRVQIVAVPYALSAANAENAAMLGGRPVSDFQLSLKAARLSSSESTQLAPEPSATIDNGATPGTVNRIPRFDSPTSIVDSVMFQNNNRIGVNTTTPDAILNVFGTSAEGPNVLISNNLTFGMRVGLTPSNVGYFGSTNLTPVQVQTNNLPRIFVTTGGNVGIGTTVPSSRLEVQDLAANAPSILVSNNLTFGMRMGLTASNAGYFGSTNLTPVQIHTNGISRVHVDTQGRVGIGTVSPVSTLDVLSNSTLAGVRATQPAVGPGVYSMAAPPPAGVRGDATNASTGVSTGLLGSAVGPDAIGVSGQNTATFGNGIGVFGISASTSGSALWGESVATGGDAVGVFGRSASASGTGVFGIATASSGDAVGVFGRSISAGGTGVWGEVTGTSGVNYGVYGRVTTSNTTSSAGTFDTTGSGNILLGRAGSSPVNVFRVDSTGRGFFNGGTQTAGADFAESVEVMDTRAQYQPGDLIGIDVAGIRRFTKIAEPYSTLVAGIYSTKPGILASPHGIDDPRPQVQEIPLAIVGIVPCKVSNENGPIKPGDLLVSSSTPGHAMKGTDRARMNGAVIGKALQPMSGTTGVIEVLVSLQ
jgi:hypothetical protein